ncbi:MAG: 4Fe-4S binding protein [Mailhella sp.]|nr:4Fe-4S binding protein [Mailhella sp.]
MHIIIDLQWCKGCGICIAFCPKKALVPDGDGKPEWRSDSCVACGLCERYCPDLAIEIRKEGGGERP